MVAGRETRKEVDVHEDGERGTGREVVLPRLCELKATIVMGMGIGMRWEDRMDVNGMGTGGWRLLDIQVFSSSIFSFFLIHLDSLSLWISLSLH